MSELAQQPHQKYKKYWDLNWISRIHSDIWPITELNVTGAQKVQDFDAIFYTYHLCVTIISNCSNLYEM